MFVTFEGLDGSGKSTQATLLVNDCQKAGKRVLFLREPGGTRVSERIRTILLDREQTDLAPRTELLLFSAARAQLVTEVILPALKRGDVVICDRFYDSTTAYQGYGRGLDLGEITALNRLASSGTPPDLTLFIDVEPDELKRRRSATVDDRMEAAGPEFYKNVREGYRKIAAAEPSRFRRIDGMRDVESIHGEIWELVRTRI